MEEYVPPNDIDAEKSVLGSILFSADAYEEVIQHIQADSFFSDAHRRIFTAVQTMYERDQRAIDVVTLANELKSRGDLDEIGGVKLLYDIMATVPHAVHAEYYAKIVKEKSCLRSILEVASDISKRANAGDLEATEILSMADKRLMDIFVSMQGGEQRTFAEILDEVFSEVVERMSSESTSGLATGLYGLDKMISGFRPTELLVLAARPGVGKSALICNFSLTTIQSGKAVLLFSLEMSRTEVAERILCMQSEVDGRRLREGDISDTSQAQLMSAAAYLKHMPIVIDDKPSRTISQISAISRRIARRMDLGIIIVDYLQLMESDDRRSSREEQIATNTRRLKGLAKDLQVPILVLSQLNREVEHRDRKIPRLSDLRSSGAIEQDADIVMFLHRPDIYDKDDRPGEADLIIAKNRHGSIGEVPLVWVGKNYRFFDRDPVQLTF